MATKRALTGGSGDLNPQLIKGAVSQAAANTIVEGEFNLPVSRVDIGAKSKASTIEIFRIYGVLSGPYAAAAGTEVRKSAHMSISTSSMGTATLAGIQDAGVIARFGQHVNNTFAAGAGAAYFNAIKDWEVWDFTDNAGHGLLVATDKFYVQLYSTGQQAGDLYACGFQIQYRYKNVGALEYVGMLQSQM